MITYVCGYVFYMSISKIIMHNILNIIINVHRYVVNMEIYDMAVQLDSHLGCKSIGYHIENSGNEYLKRQGG